MDAITGGEMSEPILSDEEFFRMSARKLRLAVVQQEYDAGHLTITEARDLLSGPL